MYMFIQTLLLTSNAIYMSIFGNHKHVSHRQYLFLHIILHSVSPKGGVKECYPFNASLTLAAESTDTQTD